jgi:hypothetical protein
MTRSASAPGSPCCRSAMAMVGEKQAPLQDRRDPARSGRWSTGGRVDVVQPGEVLTQIVVGAGGCPLASQVLSVHSFHAVRPPEAPGR